MSTQGMGLLKTREELAQWIPRQLGYPVVEVEAHFQHVEDAIDEGIKWFVAKKGTTKKVMLPVQPMRTEYTLTDDMSRVTDVLFQSPRMDLSTFSYPYWWGPDGIIPASTVFSARSGGTYSYIYQVQQYVKSAKMVLGLEMEWQQVGRTLYIFPATQTGTLAMVEYIPFKITLEQLEIRDHELISRFALAWFKRILGRILRKHKSMPGADSGVELDGAELMDEGKEELEKLEEEIAMSGFPMPIVRG